MEHTKVKLTKTLELLTWLSEMSEPFVLTIAPLTVRDTLVRKAKDAKEALAAYHKDQQTIAEYQQFAFNYGIHYAADQHTIKDLLEACEEVLEAFNVFEDSFDNKSKIQIDRVDWIRSTLEDTIAKAKAE